MSIQMILLPVFVQIGLTFALLLWIRGGRGSVSGARDARATGSFNEELGVPMLFYVLIAIAQPIRHADLVIVMLSWVFVVCRFANAGMLVTSNGGRAGSAAWLASVLVLLAMWLYFALKILLLI
jgi:hypothetical protein